MNSAFYGAKNLEINAPDTPNLSGVTDLRQMFFQASSVGGTGSTGNWNWNTSNVTLMTLMFRQATSFNKDI